MNNNKNLKILLVEDDDVDAMAFCRAMKKNNLSTPVIRAYDGKEALVILQNDQLVQPYIIILDLQMPRINGLEFIKTVRNQPELKKAVIFILTSSSSLSDINHAYSHHVAGYFVKSKDNFAVEKMIRTLSSYWRKVELPV